MLFVGVTYRYAAGSLAPPAGYQAGDLLVLLLIEQTAAVPSGWTRLGADGNGSAPDVMVAAYRVATGSDPAVTIATGASGSIVAYRNIGPPAVVNGDWSSATATTAALKLPSIVTPGVSAGCIAGVGIYGLLASGSAGAGFTLDALNGSSSRSFAWMHVDSAVGTLVPELDVVSGSHLWWGQALMVPALGGGAGMLL